MIYSHVFILINNVMQDVVSVSNVFLFRYVKEIEKKMREIMR